MDKVKRNHVVLEDDCLRCQATMALLRERPELMKAFNLEEFSPDAELVHNPILHFFVCRPLNFAAKMRARHYDDCAAARLDPCPHCTEMRAMLNARPGLAARVPRKLHQYLDDLLDKGECVHRGRDKCQRTLENMRRHVDKYDREREQLIPTGQEVESVHG